MGPMREFSAELCTRKPQRLHRGVKVEADVGYCYVICNYRLR